MLNFKAKIKIKIKNISKVKCFFNVPLKIKDLYYFKFTFQRYFSPILCSKNDR